MFLQPWSGNLPSDQEFFLHVRIRFWIGYSPLSSNFCFVSNSVRHDLALLRCVWIFLSWQTSALQLARLKILKSRYL